ncbi:MAG: CsbD family protein [Roseiarcus sp.]|jgi:uncharacterized protein YjbJ (UPF0337 family)
MSGTTDKAKGAANDVVGGAKRHIGEAIGSDKMQVEGAAQQIKGKAQQAVGDAKNAVKKAAADVDDSADRNL